MPTKSKSRSRTRKSKEKDKDKDKGKEKEKDERELRRSRRNMGKRPSPSFSSERDTKTDADPFTPLSLTDLKGNKNGRYENGDVVFGKFLNFPWWPGKVTGIEKKDNGKRHVQIMWFGDFSDAVDKVPRTRVVPFEERLIGVIVEQVRQVDLAMFEKAVKEAGVYQEEIREENGFSGDVRKALKKKMKGKVKRKRGEMERDMDGDGDGDEGIFNRPSSPIRTRPKRGKADSNALMIGLSVGSPERGLKRKAPLSEKQRMTDASHSRVAALNQMTRFHSGNDLSAFVAFHYFSLIEDGMAVNDAILSTGKKWEIGGDAVVDHINFHENAVSRPSKKRRRN